MIGKAVTTPLARLQLCTNLLLIGLAPVPVLAADCDPSVATAVSVQGSVEVRRVSVTRWQPVSLNDPFCSGDRIRVGDRSRADIALNNQPILRLDQNTTITLGGVKKEQAFLIDLVQGATYFFSRATRALEVRTAFVNAGVEGTEGVIRKGDDQTEITIFEGKVVAANDAGTLSLTSGQSAVAARGQAPTYRTVVKPRDAVHWALYYPPVMEVPPDDFAGRETNDPRVLTGRAAASLAVGRVDEASQDLERALQVDPKNSTVLALQSIIAITQNDKDKGMTLAQQAVEADPQSSSARIAQSYAQQAQFDLKGARTSLEKAVEVNPDDALAWARLAEVRMGFGEMDEALEAAKKATALNPNLARTQTVLGFAYLMQVKTAKAREAFTKAHELDQADALPKLGLGLAKMRDGEVAEGRAELEVAASLDPNNALVRSYLGKALFEEKRSDRVDREYDLAKELDPKDPTPFFYHALQKQLTNRPVEALKDLEKAIDLNDNRAVYRSKLALDSDLAARSATLGRVYSDMGFQQVALVEGWLSYNSDPMSFSAARFLADSYSVLPRHEVARVSELLRSQLLQPLNITPIQPSQALSNPLQQGALGAQALGFSEFNSLMVNRDRLTVLGSGLIGGNDTSAGEAVIAGIYKKASFSVGWNSFWTDGWRKNADQEDHNVNAFVQLELSPDTSIQAEYRYRRLERGDPRLRFFEDDFFPGEKNRVNQNTYRVGFRHDLAPNSTILGTASYNTASNSSIDDEVGFPVDSLGFGNSPSAGWGEAQHLFRSEFVNLVTGVGYSNIDDAIGITLTLNPLLVPPPFNVQQVKIDVDQEHTNIYAYSYIHLPKNVTLIIGASGDFLDSDAQQIDDKNQFNPKAGLIWEPFPGTTIRAAAFRTLKRTLIVDQTIEPTQVAGFNQFFDDFNGAETWRYGGAINQKFPQGIYAGGEFSKRDIRVPFFDTTGNASHADWDEYLGRAYLFWTPHDWLALRADYLYEHEKRDGRLPDGFFKLTSHRVPLGANFFHPSGLGAFVTGTYQKQKGLFEGFLPTDEAGTDSDSFWTLDLGLRYRLPNRYGLFTVGVSNVTDKEFQYFDTDFKNPSIQPDRVVFGKLTLALP